MMGTGSMTVSDSNSSICKFNEETPSSLTNPTATELESLRRLSENLDSIFESPTYDSYADTEIVASDGRGVPVHRCILSARSSFFKKLFLSSTKEQNKLKFKLKELAGDFDVGFDALVCVLRYFYGGKVRAAPEGVCTCVDDDECSHIACRPAIDFTVEAMYVSYVFEISELVALYQRHLLEVLDKVLIDDMLVILSVANICINACQNLLNKCIEFIVKSDIDAVTLEKSLPGHIASQIITSRHDLGLDITRTGDYFPNKHVKRIHRALDSDDVELLRMLLKEGHTTLDDAFALHYAVAYCDAKTTTELLELGLADVGRRNARGYTVLHIAATRKEPKIIVSLLTKGASPTDLTVDGRKALQISKRLTKSLDYHKSIEEGKASPKDRLCIEILEQAERRDPLLGEASVSLALAGDDLRMKLLYLENRVGLAKLLFPMEAKVAMDIAQVDGTFEFSLQTMNLVGGAQRTTVDLNEAPFRINEEHLKRMRALSRTVELGKRYFPRCSDVLNKIMDAENLTELAYMRNDGAEEGVMKKRHMELQELLSKAFTEDKEEFDRSGISSSSSSTSMGVVAKPYTKLTRRN